MSGFVQARTTAGREIDRVESSSASSTRPMSFRCDSRRSAPRVITRLIVNSNTVTRRVAAVVAKPIATGSMLGAYGAQGTSVGKSFPYRCRVNFGGRLYAGDGTGGKAPSPGNKRFTRLLTDQTALVAF